jgi:hypothetical protein
MSSTSNFPADVFATVGILGGSSDTSLYRHRIVEIDLG